MQKPVSFSHESMNKNNGRIRRQSFLRRICKERVWKNHLFLRRGRNIVKNFVSEASLFNVRASKSENGLKDELGLEKIPAEFDNSGERREDFKGPLVEFISDAGQVQKTVDYAGIDQVLLAKRKSVIIIAKDSKFIQNIRFK